MLLTPFKTSPLQARAYWIQGNSSRCTKYSLCFTSNSMQRVRVLGKMILYYGLIGGDFSSNIYSLNILLGKVSSKEVMGGKQISFTLWSSQYTLRPFILYSRKIHLDTLTRKNASPFQVHCSWGVQVCLSSLSFPEGLGTNLLLGATNKNKLSQPKSEVGLSQPKEYSNYFATFLVIKSSKKLLSLPND